MEAMHLKVELNTTIIISGVQYVITIGVSMMPRWFVVNLDMVRLFPTLEEHTSALEMVPFTWINWIVMEVNFFYTIVPDGHLVTIAVIMEMMLALFAMVGRIFFSIFYVTE